MVKVTRKQFLASAAATVSARQAPGQTSRRPNIVFLLSDQHRWDLMTSAGRDTVPTPGIDRIAASGVRFTNASCPYPVCVGSRMSLLSGLYAHHHGAVTNEHVLDPSIRTVAHHFRDSGYTTALVGKMHLNHAFLHGFDYHVSANDWLMYLGPKVQHYANDIANHQHADVFFRTVLDHGSCFPEMPGLWEKGSPWVGKVVRSSELASALEAEDHLDAFVARESVRFLESQKDKPFFLIAGFLKPHPPYHPPREYALKYPVDRVKLPPVGDISGYPAHIRQRIGRQQQLGDARLRSGLAGYLANLEFLDVCVGQVWRALEQRGMLDNTIVVYSSDHGDMLGDHGLWQKFVLYEGSVRVPLVVCWPKSIPAGKTSDALVDYMDLFPTLAELAGIRTPPKLDARSFAASCRNPSVKGRDYRFGEFALATAVPFYSVRDRQFKYIHNDGQTDELYDLESDALESRNLATDSRFAAVRKQMRDRLFDWYDPAANRYRLKREGA